MAARDPADGALGAVGSNDSGDDGDRNGHTAEAISINQLRADLGAQH